MGLVLQATRVAVVAALALACGEEPAGKEAAQTPAPPPAETPAAEPVVESLAAPTAAPAEAETDLRVGIDALPAPPRALAGPVPLSVRQPVRAALSPDGTRVVTLRAPGGDGDPARWEVVTWDVESDRALGAIQLDEGWDPKRVAFARDGSKLLVAGESAGVAVVDTATGTVVGQAGDDEERYWQAVFTPDGARFVATTDRTVELWDVATLERVTRAETASPFPELPTCPGTTPPLDASCIAIRNDDGFVSPAGTFYVQASSARISHPSYDVVTGRVDFYRPEDLAPHCVSPPLLVDSEAEVTPDSFSPDDRFFAFVPDATIGSPDRFVALIETEFCTRPPSGPSPAVPIVNNARFVVVSSNGRFALVVGDVYTAELWIPTGADRPDFRVAHVLETDRSRLSGAAFSADGRRLALFGYDGRVQGFESASGRRLFSVRVASDEQFAYRVTFLPDGRRVLVVLRNTGNDSTQAALVDTDTGRVVRRFE